MTIKKIVFFILISNLVFSQNGGLDVKSYNLYLEPNIIEKAVKGIVKVDFAINGTTSEVSFNAGDLRILEVKGESVASFNKEGKKLFITLKSERPISQHIEIAYEGKPKYGLFFSSDNSEAYTVFSTSEWMVCNDDPSDKATIAMAIKTDSKNCIASGELLKKDKGGLFSFLQSFESPSYTYGFAIGDFNEHISNETHTRVKSYAAKYNKKEIGQIFQYTEDMLRFFEEKSGVPYVQNTYSQILMGNHYQEMSGFAVLKESYGNMILADSTETNLISHELAHQWWGNIITCKNWNHFWLNEGLATFMSAAYNEHRFGKAKYESDMNSYLRVYKSIVTKGEDKPLVFPNWDRPTSDDRNIVYFKGAYVFHLLRKELGEELFWKGIKDYSKMNWGKAVVTKDFQESMESSTGRSLQSFFEKWIY